MNRTETRQLQRDRVKQARALFDKAMAQAEHVEAGIKMVVNALPWWRRVALAARIVWGMWR